MNQPVPGPGRRLRRRRARRPRPYAEELRRRVLRRRPGRLSTGENNLFGKGTTQARHFTAYGLKHDTTGLTNKRLDSDIPELLRLMNPMRFLAEKANPRRSKHWWIRLGTKDSDTSHTASANIAAGTHGLGDDVSHLYYWDEGHGANTDPGDFIEWIARIAKVSGPRAKAE